MEPAFRQSLYKKFVKTIEKPNLHPLLVVDAINAKREHFEPFYQAALAKGYATFVASLDADIAECAKNNTHNWDLTQLQTMRQGWEETPAYMQVKNRSYLPCSEHALFGNNILLI